MFERFRKVDLAPVERGVEFETYFMSTVAPVLKLAGCSIWDMRGTRMDYVHGVDVIIQHKDVGAIKVDLCYDVQSKIRHREGVLRDNPGRLKTEGLISNRMVELLRSRKITTAQLLHGSKALWTQSI